VLDKGVPELAAKVERGEIKVSVAADIARFDKDSQREIILEGDKLRAITREGSTQGGEINRISKPSSSVKEKAARYFAEQEARLGPIADATFWAIVWLLVDALHTLSPERRNYEISRLFGFIGEHFGDGIETDTTPERPVLN